MRGLRAAPASTPPSFPSTAAMRASSVFTTESLACGAARRRSASTSPGGTRGGSCRGGDAGARGGDVGKRGGDRGGEAGKRAGEAGGVRAGDRAGRRCGDAGGLL